jgi:hypothetical protein
VCASLDTEMLKAAQTKFGISCCLQPVLLKMKLQDDTRISSDVYHFNHAEFNNFDAGQKHGAKKVKPAKRIALIVGHLHS